VKPQRIPLSRRGGFRLQDASRSINGRDAVRVARPTKWGNPFKVDGMQTVAFGESGDAAGRAAAAVKAYRMLLDGEFKKGREDKRTPFQRAIMTLETGFAAPTIREIRDELRGKNLACWCKPGAACHADVLLEIANAAEGDAKQ